MKPKAVILLMAALLISTFSFGQSEANKKKVYYAIVIRESGGGAKNILFNVTDSSLVLLDQKDSSIQSVSYREIEKIKIRKKGTTGVSIAVSAGIGAGTGALVGFAANDAAGVTYVSDAGAAGAGMLIGSFLGAITGAIIGPFLIKVIVVNYDAETFRNSATEIRKYCQQQQVNQPGTLNQ
jgi:hypothetical protein